MSRTRSWGAADGARPEGTVDDGRGRKLTWRRIDANTEGLVDLTALAAGDAKPAKASGKSAAGK